eukprot:TRINITY_DN123032_c0_g1_i1.p1 TRINITY_DN123032_c0_g1~~TRINITY_DN123032_c0_g1_i1.p1  ORF type:complete len:211 (+),score=40.37 TRINITY_DN123032_c0_g1_i1:156-788(+)
MRQSSVLGRNVPSVPASQSYSQPVSVNPKQFDRILKRRAARLRLQKRMGTIDPSKPSKLHLARSIAAKKRVRTSDGAFLRKKKRRLEVEDASNQNDENEGVEESKSKEIEELLESAEQKSLIRFPPLTSTALGSHETISSKSAEFNIPASTSQHIVEHSLMKNAAEELVGVNGDLSIDGDNLNDMSFDSRFQADHSLPFGIMDSDLDRSL